MDSVSTPRISANMLDSYVGQNVIVVGKVMQLRGDSALLDANGQVNAILNLAMLPTVANIDLSHQESHLMAGNGAQIIGKVLDDLSVKVYNAKDLGSNVDYQVAQSVVDITQQYKHFITITNGACLATVAELLPINFTVPSSPSSYSAAAGFGCEFLFIFQFPIRPSTELSLHSITPHDAQPVEPDFESTSPSSSESDHSFSSGKFGSTSSLIDGLSSLAIQHEEPPSSQLPSSQTWHSSSIDDSSPSPSPSLEEALSQFALEQDRSLSSHVTTAGSNRWWQPSVSGTQSSRPVSEVSYDSSSSEDLSLVRGRLDDDVFSQPANEDETPQSSQSTIEGTKSLEPAYQDDYEPSECSDLSFPVTPMREPEAITPNHVSPSSTGKLSCPSPVQSSTHPNPSSPIQSPQSSRSPQSPRLYRTRSGNLASVAELRQRRELEEAQLDIVLRGIRKVQRPLIDIQDSEGGYSFLDFDLKQR
ncbi:hypothetical protein NPX13_g8801 [Xylaria arbuscula]|uniref:Uncharacterized protein n=1 Tax=Xylaria arbuscula TaxID=114810 RepID=A0A9W8N7Z2_9PEZI|nr:hypothetical protein NPX13_g8801 [Xylaria arbuscula]